MPAKKYTPEQIVILLRQIEVAGGFGKTTPQACREAGITDQTYYRWRRELSGLKLDQAKRLKALEQENAELKRPVAASRQACGVNRQYLHLLQQDLFSFVSLPRHTQRSS